MIRQAKIKAQYQQYNMVKTAIYTYVDRYGISSFYDPSKISVTAHSTVKNLTDLARLGLVHGIGTHSSGATRYLNKYGLDSTIFGPGDITHLFRPLGLLNKIVFCSSVPPDVAEEIDRKYDDGKPLKGNIRYPTSGALNPLLCEHISGLI